MRKTTLALLLSTALITTKCSMASKTKVQELLQDSGRDLGAYANFEEFWSDVRHQTFAPQLTKEEWESGGKKTPVPPA